MSKNRMERIAERVVSAYQELPVLQGRKADRIDPELIAKDLLGLSIEYHSLSPNGTILGETSCGEIGVPIFDTSGEPDYFFLDGKTILIERSLVSGRANKGRYHFTLMHETAHQLLGMILFDKEGKGSPRHQIHYSKENCLSEEDYWEEWRANYLASAILMPEQALCENLKLFGLGDKIKRLNKDLYPREYAGFCKMAQYMGVSYQALSIRLTELGLLKRNDLKILHCGVNVMPGEEWMAVEREMDNR